MPDYTNSSMSASRTSQSRQVTDPLSSDRDTRRYQSLQSAGAVESLCEALKSVKDSRSEGNAFGGKDDNPIANHPVPYMNTPHCQLYISLQEIMTC